MAHRGAGRNLGDLGHPHLVRHQVGDLHVGQIHWRAQLGRHLEAVALAAAGDQPLGVEAVARMPSAVSVDPNHGPVSAAWRVSTHPGR